VPGRRLTGLSTSGIIGGVTAGVVRAWQAEEGWGVLDSEETPGGCWAHFSALDMSGYRALAAGQQVEFSHERVPQDGYEFRASTVRLRDNAGTEPDHVVEHDPGYSSTLDIVMDDD
jgi:CspA family cold shock protein